MLLLLGDEDFVFERSVWQQVALTIACSIDTSSIRYPFSVHILNYMLKAMLTLPFQREFINL
jgi:hypothetical protein